MAAQLTDAFKKTGAGTVTTLAAPGKAAAAVAITVGATTNYPTDTGLVIAIRQVDSAGELVAGTYTEWSAISTSGTTFTIDPVPVYGSDQVYAAGSTTQVYIPLSSYAHNELIDGILVEHNQDGTHSDITATTVTADEFIVTGSAGANNGWEVGLPTPDTITYNGNRSYDLVFNSNDLTDTLSNGMRTRFTRTVTPPTQCTDLESGSSQYWSKTSPAGTTFTDDFCAGAWIKLESYTGTNQAIISRYNGTSGWNMSIDSTGRIFLAGYNGGSTNQSYVRTYQSLPLNKWVHVAAQLDMSAFTATTTTSYVMIDGVNVPVEVARGGTNPTTLVQAGNLEIGSTNGTNFYDGELAQVWYSNAKITQSTIQTFISQGMTGSETSIVSHFDFNGDGNDNNANANNLTANAGAGFSTDSPFNATEYGIITKNAFSTDTTLTVQVPEGYAIPTSGGVSAVAYSTQDVPYGFPRSSSKWDIQWLFGQSGTKSSPTASTWYSGATANGEWSFSVPTGSWIGNSNLIILGILNSGTQCNVVSTISTSSSSETNTESTAAYTVYGATGAIRAGGKASTVFNVVTTTATTMYVCLKSGATITSVAMRGDDTMCSVTLTPAYV